MVVAQIWKKLAQKFGVETGRFIMHLSLFTIAFIYSALQYFGYWQLFGTTLIQIWATASGLYEIAKTIIEKVIQQKK